VIASGLAILVKVINILHFSYQFPNPLPWAKIAQLGAGYGVSTPAMIKAVRLMASQEGLLLDPSMAAKRSPGCWPTFRPDDIKPATTSSSS
jgi:1-aminocyclopropane-1-carboxylate deaminase/D-cysteine desulfhydrase-like pyridoxal-dependent ACC family enzyme